MINTPKIYKMRIVFRLVQKGPNKQDPVVVLRQQIRQSGLVYAPAKGGESYPRVAYGPAAGRGVRTEREYADIYLKQPVLPGQLQNLLSNPEIGLEVLAVMRVPYAFASVQYLATAAVYRVEGNFEAYPAHLSAEEFFNAPQVKITRTFANGMTWVVDERPFIVRAETSDGTNVLLTLQSVEGKWANPQELVAAWLGMNPTELGGIQIIREGLYWQDSAGELHRI